MQPFSDKKKISKFNLFQPILILNLILFFIQFQNILSVVEGTCYQVTTYNNLTCFNDKIEFHDKFRAGHFVTLKDGSLIIEYSSDGVNYQRFFYGLKKNGRYYFENESPFKHFTTKNPNNENHGRYESENEIVYLKSDTNKENQYIFSTSIWKTVTELHDLAGNRSTYWDTVDLWKIVEIFSYEINILELKENNEMHYLAVFTQHETDQRLVDGIRYDYSKTWSIRKFKINSFNSIDVSTTEKVDYTSNYNSRMISAFIVYEWEKIVVFFLKKADEVYTNAYYTIAFYSYSLTWICEVQKEWVSEPHSGNGIFFRAFLIKERYAAFVYFTDTSGQNLKFEVGQLTDKNNYYFEYRIQETFKNLGFSSDIRFNDFFKVDGKRFVLITCKTTFKSIIVVIFDIFNDYYNYRIRAYYYDNFDNQLEKEVQGYTFNGYIIYTFVSKPSDMFSTLLFFGYANGTDFTIDISPYLMDTGYYQSENNLYNMLVKTCTIDNNIFGYEFVPKINLVWYPNELLFYNGTGTKKEANKLPNNSFFDANHTLYQNRAINKTHKYYYLEYQFLVKEPPFDTAFKVPHVHNLIGDNCNGFFKDEYVQKTFYGRTNRLYFKLCHDYCGSCIEYGITENEQKCLTCLEEYSFDYWFYLKNILRIVFLMDIFMIMRHQPWFNVIV